MGLMYAYDTGYVMYSTGISYLMIADK